MSRRQRQTDELRALCSHGALARAIDLAFAHFADFGRDDDVIAQLAAAIDSASAPPDLVLRFEELQTAIL